ncbi:hypothetical protein [Microbacterium pumilum]|uniref:Uncharacterized protein n=1 Tax=Microbacterium pumilum TaxID=344165 RepID=A0ABN2RTL0_9MICO
MTDTAGAGWTGEQTAVGDIAPALAHDTDKVLFAVARDAFGTSGKES